MCTIFTYKIVFLNSFIFLFIWKKYAATCNQKCNEKLIAGLVKQKTKSGSTITENQFILILQAKLVRAIC